MCTVRAHGSELYLPSWNSQVGERDCKQAIGYPHRNFVCRDECMCLRVGGGPTLRLVLREGL